MQVTLNFHPDLQHLFPASVTLDAPNPLSALRLLGEQHPLNGKVDPTPIKVVELPSLSALEHSYNQDLTLNVVPAEAVPLLGASGYSGSSGDSSSWLNVALGVVLIVASFYTFGAATALGLSAKAATTAASVVLSVGVSLTLTGIMQMLAPDPDEPENRKSAYFSATKSTVSADTPIPLSFGRRRIFGHYLSVNIDARNFNGDLSAESDWFEGKVTETIPSLRLRNFYGIIRASGKNIDLQVNNEDDKTGTQV